MSTFLSWLVRLLFSKPNLTYCSGQERVSKRVRCSTLSISVVFLLQQYPSLSFLYSTQECLLLLTDERDLCPGTVSLFRHFHAKFIVNCQNLFELWMKVTETAGSAWDSKYLGLKIAEITAKLSVMTFTDDSTEIFILCHTHRLTWRPEIVKVSSPPRRHWTWGRVICPHKLLTLISQTHTLYCEERM
jgi:hypothetical protein